MDNKQKQTMEKEGMTMAIYAPVEEIRHIEQVIDNLETVRRKLMEVAEGMKPIMNEV